MKKKITCFCPTDLQSIFASSINFFKTGEGFSFNDLYVDIVCRDKFYPFGILNQFRSIFKDNRALRILFAGGTTTLRAHPINIQAVIRHGKTKPFRDQALALLDDDQIHLAVGWFERAPERFAAELMFEERLTVLCRQDHPILSVDNVDLETVLSFEHLVVSSSGDRKAGFDDLLARRGKRRDVAVSVSNFSVVTDLLNGDDLIGIFTRRVADVLAQRFGLATLDTPSEIPALDHYMVWHNRFDTDRRHEWLRARVTEACAG